MPGKSITFVTKYILKKSYIRFLSNHYKTFRHGSQNNYSAKDAKVYTSLKPPRYTVLVRVHFRNRRGKRQLTSDDLRISGSLLQVTDDLGASAPLGKVWVALKRAVG